MLNTSLINKPINTSADLSVEGLAQCPKHVLCYYVNQTTQIHIIRINNCPIFYFERVVFPQQHFLFTAPKAAQIEVYTSEIASAVLLDRIPSEQLSVNLTIDSPLSHQEFN